MTEGNSKQSVDAAPGPRSGHKVVRVGGDGSAWIEAWRCSACGAVALEETRACRGCAARGTLAPFRPSRSGKLYSWAVIHRSYLGVSVPFVSAVVDLDGGLTLKGTLRLDDLETLHAGMPVRLVMDDAGGAVDKEGRPYAGFHFTAGGECE